MSVELEIQDGDPWWASPNIWVVPGPAPDGPAGTPLAGASSFVWARVRNRGGTAVQNAVVRFYWANPSVGVDRNSAYVIGTSFVSLDPGQESDVLCLTPWIPSYVNEGHECLLAEAFHASADPLPAVASFDVPTDRHVAQRNISVVQVAMSMFKSSFEIHNRHGKKRRYTVKATQKAVPLRFDLLEKLGLGKRLLDLNGKVTSVRFTKDPCPIEKPGTEAEEGPTEHSVTLEPHGRGGLTVMGRMKGDTAILHVEQFSEGRSVGGLTLLLVNSEKHHLADPSHGKGV